VSQGIAFLFAKLVSDRCGWCCAGVCVYVCVQACLTVRFLVIWCRCQRPQEACTCCSCNPDSCRQVSGCGCGCFSQHAELQQLDTV
jgi:hypothetical protein